MRLALAALVAILPGCATSSPKAASRVTTAAPATAAAELVDHEGDSPASAVAVPADAPAEGMKFENDWIYDRIGRFRRSSVGTGSMSGRRYDVIEVETPSGERHKFYFDITENWNRWKPPK